MPLYIPSHIITEKFSAIPPTGRDDICQSTANFVVIFEYLISKQLFGSLVSDGVIICKHWSSCTNCEILREHRPSAPEI